MYLLFRSSYTSKTRSLFPNVSGGAIAPPLVEDVDIVLLPVLKSSQGDPMAGPQGLRVGLLHTYFNFSPKTESDKFSRS